MITSGFPRAGLKQRVGLFLGPILGAVVYFLPFPHLTIPAHTLAAILTWVVIYWITEAIPLPVTSLLGATFCVVGGLGSVKTVFANFAHPIIFMFIGSFFIAEAFVVHKVDRRFATWLLSFQWVRGTPSRIFFTVGCATALLSMWISNTAAVAIMVPIVLGLLSTIRGSDEDHARYEPGVMLLLAYGAAAGGVVTMIGTPPNLIGVGLLSEQADINLPFHTWFWVGLPLGIIMFLVIFTVLLWLHTPPSALPSLREHVQELRANLGNWTTGQVNACVALGLAVCLWVVPGLLAGMVGRDHDVVVWLNARFPKELVAVLAAGLLFVLPVNAQKGEFTLSWKQAANIDWGTILLFGGGLAFGHLMVSTGLAEAVGRGMVTLFGGNTLWSLTAVAIVVALVLTEMASNTAAASMLIPVVIAIAQSANVSPVPPTLGVCMAASLAFVMPVSTPPNAIVYGTGLVPLMHMLRAGIILNPLGAGIIFVVLRLVCPLLGLT